MSFRSLLVLSACLLPVAVAGAQAADKRAEIARRLDIKVDEVRPAPVKGLYEVAAGSEVGYVSVDGRYYIDGDVFDMETRDNLTEQRRRQARVALLKGIPDAEAVVFAPSGATRHTITVFTDIDCSYCRKLHSEIDELNKLGVKVRYLAFPRSGPGTESWTKAESVWCSMNRRDALTRAKRGEAVTAAKCANPVDRQWQLAREIGIRGTPGILTADGDYLAGYLPAPRLLEYLDNPQRR